MGKTLFWKCQIWGWAAFVILSFPAKMIVLGSLSAAVISLYRDGIGFLLTWGMHEIYRKISYRRVPVLGVILLILVLSFLSSGIEMAVSRALHRVILFEEAGFSNGTVATGVFYYRAALFACWSFLYFGVWLVYEAMEKDGRLAHAIEGHREAELQLLRMQINPHFLFNSLNAILNVLERQKQGGIRMVQALCDFLNYSLIHKDDNFVSLGEEYDALTDYLALEKVRFGKNLDLACRIEPEARSSQVPGVLLQPLIENAIKFSRETSTPPFIVRLNITQEESALLIEVCNTGHWITPDPHRMAGGVGLENIRKRLEWLYPGRHTVEVVPEEGWVAVRIRIP